MANFIRGIKVGKKILMIEDYNDDKLEKFDLKYSRNGEIIYELELKSIKKVVVTVE